MKINYFKKMTNANLQKIYVDIFILWSKHAVSSRKISVMKILEHISKQENDVNALRRYIQQIFVRIALRL